MVDRDHGDGRAAKCTLCYDRLSDGLEPACAKACPTDSIQFGPYEELVDVARRRVGRLHEHGIEGAYLYGAGDEPGEELAGGLGAFFLLTLPPERYGLPAQADSPIQENGPRGERRRARRRVRGRGATAASLAAPTPGPPVSHLRASARRRRRSRARAARPQRRARHDAGARHARRPGPCRRAVEGAAVALHRPRWGDARWSYLFGADTDYARRARRRGTVEAAARRARAGPPPDRVQGPMMKAPVWTWEVPLYFWFGGIASGAAFVALACDLAGDHRSARTARLVALGGAGALSAAARSWTSGARSASSTCCASSSRARRCRWAPGR